jgi:hypothetical protein
MFEGLEYVRRHAGAVQAEGHGVGLESIEAPKPHTRTVSGCFRLSCRTRFAQRQYARSEIG